MISVASTRSSTEHERLPTRGMAVIPALSGDFPEFGGSAYLGGADRTPGRNEICHAVSRGLRGVRIPCPASSFPQRRCFRRPRRPGRPMDPADGVRRIKCSPHEMSDGVTTADDLFVIAHLGIPQVDQAGWSLAIDGLVDRPHTLKLDDLKSRPKKVLEAVRQCCGSPLEPRMHPPERRHAQRDSHGAHRRAIGLRARQFSQKRPRKSLATKRAAQPTTSISTTLNR